MKTQTLIRSAARVSMYGAVLAATAFATYAGYKWIHFGDVTAAATNPSEIRNKKQKEKLAFRRGQLCWQAATNRGHS